MPKLKVTARQCSVCGGPIQDRNTMGICHRNAACEAARAEVRRRAKGMKPHRPGGCRAGKCPKSHYADGWCQMHWLRVKRTGDPGPDGNLRHRYSAKAGDVLGTWTLLDDYKHDLMPCRCICGNQRLISIQFLLKQVDQLDCICGRAGRPPGRSMINFPGRIYLPAGYVGGRLTLLEDAMHSTDHPRCMCECGTETTSAIAANVKQGSTRSCGCLGQESRTKHGLSKHPLYCLWHGIVTRCTNPKVPEYRHYGGRGITLCERWTGLPDGLLNFAEDMGPRPSPHHTIDRQNNDGNYEPGNCAWKTSSEQNRNRRKVDVLTGQRNAAWARVQELEQELAAARGTLF